MGRFPLLECMVLCVGLTCLGVAQAKTASPKAHEHGMAQMDVAIDGQQIAIGLEIPGDGVFGFEHPAKTATEKEVVAKAMKTLREDATTLFLLPADLGCKVVTAEVKEDHHGAHADVDADYTFQCEKSPTTAKLRLGLLKAFPRVGKVKVQVASSTGQSVTTVASDQDVITL